MKAVNFHFSREDDSGSATPVIRSSEVGETFDEELIDEGTKAKQIKKN